MNGASIQPRHHHHAVRAYLAAHPRAAAFMLFALYLTLWWLANSTAAGSAWWTSDDYSHTYQFGAAHHLRQGRPLAVPILALSTLEQGRAGLLLNPLLRSLQGAVHALTALLMALILWRRTQSPMAWLAPLIWLLWPYNGEAVLWRAAAIIPYAACLSVAAAWCIDRREAGGGGVWLLGGLALGIAAPLAHQHGAITGIVVWLAVIAAQRTPPGRREIAGLLWLGVAYGIGGAIGSTLSWAMGDFFASRGGFAASLDAKRTYLFLLVRSFLLDVYSTPITLLQALLVAGAPALLVVHALRGTEKVAAMGLRLTAYALLIIAPFAPLLLPAESPLSARHFYAAPLMLVAAALVLDIRLPAGQITRRTPAILVTTLLVLYLPFAQQNGLEMIRVYRSDRATLTLLNEAIRLQRPDGPVTLVFADPNAYPVAWDPYAITDFARDSRTDRSSDSKLSSFLTPWAFVPFVQAQSEFSATVEPELVDRCVAACPLHETRVPLQFVFLEASELVCLCSAPP